MRSLEETRAYFADDRFATGLCGIVIEEAAEERSVCRMPLTPEHHNALGFAQGGAIFTLCDTVFGVAANAGNVLTVSLGAQITFLRPGAGEFLTAEATLVSSTKSTCLYRVEVFNDQNALIAFATVNGFRKG
jgi:acyl-CoA thioesterase